MTDVLSGNISLVKLIDILSLLTSEKKTGVVNVERGIEKGEIYLDNGVLTHAISKSGVGEEAVFTLLTWMEGNFKFVPDLTSEEKSINRDTPSLLEEGIKRLEEWDQIKEIIPSQELVFKLSTLRVPEEITVKYDEWSVLTQIDGNKTVGEISDGLEMGEYDTAKIIYKLFLAGLIDVAMEPKLKSKEIVDPGFLDFMEKKLREIIGPVASVVLEEEIRAMGEEKENFPMGKVSFLVEKMSGEIADENETMHFQKMILGAIRNRRSKDEPGEDIEEEKELQKALSGSEEAVDTAKIKETLKDMGIKFNPPD